jgi:hypothetical protein
MPIEGNPWVYECTAHDVLTPAQISALGLVAAEWGMLEAALRSHGAGLYRLSFFNVLTGNPGGKQLAEILRETVGGYVPAGKERDKLIAVFAAVSPLADRRNDLMHACWGVVLIATGRMPAEGPLGRREKGRKAFGGLIKRRGIKSASISLSAAEMKALAVELRNVRYRLNRLALDIEWMQTDPKERFNKFSFQGIEPRKRKVRRKKKAS